MWFGLCAQQLAESRMAEAAGLSLHAYAKAGRRRRGRRHATAGARQAAGGGAA